MTAFWLPVYSPHLNLIERVWRFLTAKLARHRFWNDVTGLEAAATTALNRIEAHFNTSNGPAVRLA